MGIKHYNITVSGRVQGVGFRYSAMMMAISYNIRGFVRNQADGSVYIEAEGEKPDLGRFIEWCRNGPGFGRIDRVTSSESGVRGFREFVIRH